MLCCLLNPRAVFLDIFLSPLWSGRMFQFSATLPVWLKFLFPHFMISHFKMSSSNFMFLLRCKPSTWSHKICEKSICLSSSSDAVGGTCVYRKVLEHYTHAFMFVSITCVAAFFQIPHNHQPCFACLRSKEKLSAECFLCWESQISKLLYGLVCKWLLTSLCSERRKEGLCSLFPSYWMY